MHHSAPRKRMPRTRRNSIVLKNGTSKTTDTFNRSMTRRTVPTQTSANDVNDSTDQNTSTTCSNVNEDNSNSAHHSFHQHPLNSSSLLSSPLDYYAQTYARILLRQLHLNSLSLYVDWDQCVHSNESSTKSSDATTSTGLPDVLLHLSETLQSCLGCQQSFATLLLGPPETRKISAIQTAAHWVNRRQQQQQDTLACEKVDHGVPLRMTRSKTKQQTLKHSAISTSIRTDCSISKSPPSVTRFQVIVIPGICQSEISWLSCIVRQLFRSFLSAFSILSDDQKKHLFEALTSQDSNSQSLHNYNAGKPIESDDLLEALIRKTNTKWAIKSHKKMEPSVATPRNKSAQSTKTFRVKLMRDELKSLSFQQNVVFIKELLVYTKSLNYIPILVLENIEALVLGTQRQTVLYNLFNLIHIKSICLGIIGTSSVLNLASGFEKRVKSRFGLSRVFSGVIQMPEVRNSINLLSI